MLHVPCSTTSSGSAMLLPRECCRQTTMISTPCLSGTTIYYNLPLLLFETPMTGVVQLYMDTLIKRVSLANRTTAAISMLRTDLQQLYQFTAVLHTSLS